MITAPFNKLKEGSSPLSRGIRSNNVQDDIVRGIIPALAGNTPALGIVTQPAEDHPRSRGEYVVVLGAVPICAGSSPLSRGIHHGFRFQQWPEGIIPALAGNTHYPGCNTWVGLDHPRSRGEYQLINSLLLGGGGSSPLSRGIPSSSAPSPASNGIIPALAGNTTTVPTSTARRWDHPRSRGEYMALSPLLFHQQGSSPLSRGIPRHGVAPPPAAGIFPALAGNTGGSVWVTSCARGSSPLSRGIRPQVGDVVQPRGIIPALAGNTPAACTFKQETGDHPRSRGEYREIPRGEFGKHGSSPLSRGIRRVIENESVYEGIIPALAGNTGTPCARSTSAADHPRSRGEYLLTRDFISWTCRILGTPSSHVSASRSHSPRVCGGRHPDGASRLARRLKDLGGPSGLAPHNRLAPMGHPMSGRTYPARSWRETP